VHSNQLDALDVKFKEKKSYMDKSTEGFNVCHQLEETARGIAMSQISRQPIHRWVVNEAEYVSHERRLLLALLEVGAGRPTGGEQRHGHHPAPAFLRREHAEVDGHVGLDEARVHAVDAQRGVLPRQDPRVGIQRRLGHHVRRRETSRPPPSRLHGAALQVLHEHGRQLVQPLLGQALHVVQLPLQSLAAEKLHEFHPSAGFGFRSCHEVAEGND